MEAHMVSQPKSLGNPQEQKAKDIDRLVNEGGPEFVSAQELARRKEVWNQSQKGNNQLTLDVELRVIALLEHMAKGERVTLQVLVGSILNQYCQSVMAEHNNVQ
jgi:hypothetical protein